MDSVFLKRKDYVRVQYPSGKLSYGGSQQWLNQGDRFGKVLDGSGCGTVAVADLLLYRAFDRPRERTPLLRELAGRSPLSREEYCDFVRKIARRFVRPLPRLGMTGMRLAACLNRYFGMYRLELRARWRLCVTERDLAKSLAEVLQRNMPVVLSVPPRLFFGKGLGMKNLTAGRQEHYRAHSGHFVSVTALQCCDGKPQELILSSWGQRYAVDWDELIHCFHTPVGALVCGFLDVR